MTLPPARDYRIGNDLEHIAGVVGDLLDALRPYLAVDGQLEVALYEALYNAIEHGNLGLSCAEKKRLIENGSYDQFLAERRRQVPYADRSVAIALRITAREALVTIADGGGGFDWRARLAAMQDEEALLEVNGRGLKIMQSAFDELRFNDAGNAVTLIKKRESA